MVILVAIGAVLTTFFGGLFALKFRDKLHLILGFSAGAVIGVAFFDLLPEAISIGGEKVASIIALGFVIYLLFDRLIFGHGHDENNCERHQNRRGYLSAGSLSLHSFIDGLAVGFAFQASNAIGMVVSLAVLSHAFSDGINTVGLILKGGGTKKEAFKWLAVDASAPFLGILSSFLFNPNEKILGIILALFCGSFLYMGASDLLPESHHAHPTFLTTLMTIIGIATLFLIINFAV